MYSDAMWLASLSDDDLVLSRTYALQRSQRKRERHVRNRRIGKQPDFEIDYLGLRGEMAFARTFGLQVHQITENLLCGDGGHKDFDLLRLIVSVKTRPANRRWFLVPNYLYPPTADLLVFLEEADERHIQFIGWCTSDDFVARHTRPDLGYGPTRGIRDAQLRPMNDFLRLMDRLMQADGS